MSMPEASIRILVFTGIFTAIALLEYFFPRRRAGDDRRHRWIANFGMLIAGTALLRLFFPLAAVGVALFAEQHGIGLFNLVSAPAWLAITVALLSLDCLIYWQHRLLHRIPWLWPIHKPHHTDLQVDVSTGIRFHPLEMLLSMLIKAAIILLLGLPAIAVLVFEVLLSTGALFTHGNIRLPLTFDRWLRYWIVTPDMHRIHHSVERDETDSNFSFNLSCWDRLFGSYRAEPRSDQATMPLGLPHYRNTGQLGLLQILRMPFLSGK